MNHNDSENHLGIRTFHKCRKKRKRSKYKGSTKKCQKTVAPVLKQHTVSSVQKRYFSKHKRNKDSLLVQKKVMSSWYWHNYNKAMAWRNKHNVAYWKAYALALQSENNYLLGIVKKLDPGKIVNIPATNQNNYDDEKISHVESASGASTSNIHAGDIDEFQFEMSEEMMSFFEKSFKHKMDLKKAREETEKKADGDGFLKEAQKIRLQREEEMKCLYGDGASMIVGMETAVQLSYERYCDTKSPKYWPNIPLRL